MPFKGNFAQFERSLILAHGLPPLAVDTESVLPEIARLQLFGMFPGLRTLPKQKFIRTALNPESETLVLQVSKSLR